jgi:hypothetical protein
LTNFAISGISVVTESGSVADVRGLMESFPHQISVLNEENLLSNHARGLLRKKFGARYGWALQQFLKLQTVLVTSECPSLVIDADTLLVKPRNWVDSAGVQVLMPTEEFHQQYYDVLNRLNFKVNPHFSFVSHHMIYQPELLQECILEIGVESIEQLIELICSFDYGEGIESFFSIDYEMYAQFMLNKHPELCRLERWGNVELDFNKVDYVPLEELPGLMSISAHSWKNS